jgi:hypothetical protein
MLPKKQYEILDKLLENRTFILSLNSGSRLMGSRIIGWIGWWNQDNPEWQVPNHSFVPNLGWSSFAYCYHLWVNGISYGLAQS